MTIASGGCSKMQRMNKQLLSTLAMCLLFNLASVNAMMCMNPVVSAVKNAGEVCGGFCEQNGLCKDDLRCHLGNFKVSDLPVVGMAAPPGICRDPAADAKKYCENTCISKADNVTTLKSTLLDMVSDGEITRLTRDLNFKHTVAGLLDGNTIPRILCLQEVTVSASALQGLALPEQFKIVRMIIDVDSTTFEAADKLLRLLVVVGADGVATNVMLPPLTFTEQDFRACA